MEFGLAFGLVLILSWVDWLWLGLGLGYPWLPFWNCNRIIGWFSSPPQSRVLCLFPFSFAFSRPCSIGLLCGAALLRRPGTVFFSFFPFFFPFLPCVL